MPPRILIVHDPLAEPEVLPDDLQHAGFETVIASHGQQALALAEDVRPSAILLSAALPGMDGIETCRRLRLNPATTLIPVIVLCASESARVRGDAALAGANDVLTCPVDLDDLVSRLQRLTRSADAAPADHRRLLQEMAYTIVTVLPARLVWLLAADAASRWLQHQAIVIDQPELATQFMIALQGQRPDLRFPLVRGDNPFADVTLARSVMFNISAAHFDTLPGGEPIHQLFSQFDLPYLSLLPLATGGRAVGVMIVATQDARTVEARRTQQILHSFSEQAAIAVENTRLLGDLTARETQMRAEQSFRQTVLDSMGEGLIVVDEQARITYVNGRLLRMTGYTRAALYGHSVDLLFPPSARDEVITRITGRSRTTAAFSQTLLTSEGRSVPVLISRVITPSPVGEGSSAIVVVTDLTDLQRHEHALRLQTQRLEALNAAANAIASASVFEDVVRASLESSLQIVQGVSAAILLRDAEDNSLFTATAALGPHSEAALARQVRAGEGLAGQAAQSATARLARQGEAGADELLEYAAITGTPPRSVLVVPLIAFDEVVGLLEVYDKLTGVFDDQDLALLESLTVSAAITIENTRLYEETRRRVSELSTLLDASAAVTTTLDFGDILQRIARRLSLALQVQRVVINDWQRQHNRLVTLAEVANAGWPPGRGPARRADELPLTLSALQTARLTVAQSPSERSTSGLRAVVAFPLIVQRAVVGALTLYGHTTSSLLEPTVVEAVGDIVTRWQSAVEHDDPDGWAAYTALTELAQQALQASDLRWASVFEWDPEHYRARLLREIGQAVWAQRPTQAWSVDQYPTVKGVLQSGSPAIVYVDGISDDPHEQAYLRRVGAETCLIAPLIIRGESGGIVRLIDTERPHRTFDNAELSLCQGIANVVGNAMENAQLYAAQEQRATALEAAYKDLQEADRMKDELLQNLSHELRTPLTHILGYLRLMSDGAFGDLNDEQHQTLDLVLQKADHLAELVNDIVSVQEARPGTLVCKPVHLDRVLANAIRAMTPKLQAQGLRLVPRIPANLPLVYADPVRIGDVFEELLENAIKFSPNGGQIDITIEDPGGPHLQASVRDRGIGIPPAEQERIFERFYQVERGTTRRFGGTGLGLAIVQQVIQGHNGRIWVESAPGQGSCFTFTLPKARAVAEKS